MQVGTLVRRAETIDPRIGIVEEAFGDRCHPAKVICVVRWHTGQYGHYYAEYLEVLCK